MSVVLGMCRSELLSHQWQANQLQAQGGACRQLQSLEGAYGCLVHVSKLLMCGPRKAHLWHKGDTDGAVKHAGAHLEKDPWLDHVIAVHDHEDVVLGNVGCAARVRIDLGENGVVQIGTLAVQLATVDAIADVHHICMPCSGRCLSGTRTDWSTGAQQCRVLWRQPCS